MNKSVILLSGGIDSAVLLADARNKQPAEECLCLSFHYGQRHARELESACAVAEYYEVEYHYYALPFGITSHKSSLTYGTGVMTGKDTIVPGRNLMFVSVAVALA